MNDSQINLMEKLKIIFAMKDNTEKQIDNYLQRTIFQMSYIRQVYDLLYKNLDIINSDIYQTNNSLYLFKLMIFKKSSDCKKDLLKVLYEHKNKLKYDDFEHLINLEIINKAQELYILINKVDSKMQEYNYEKYNIFINDNGDLI